MKTIDAKFKEADDMLMKLRVKNLPLEKELYDIQAVLFQIQDTLSQPQEQPEKIETCLTCEYYNEGINNIPCSQCKYASEDSKVSMYELNEIDKQPEIEVIDFANILGDDAVGRAYAKDCFQLAQSMVAKAIAEANETIKQSLKDQLSLAFDVKELKKAVEERDREIKKCKLFIDKCGQEIGGLESQLKSPQEQKGVDVEKLAKEASYLLFTKQPDNCLNWEENVGDCHKAECEFCRIQACIDKLQTLQSNAGGFSEDDIKYLKEIRNYFGENDATIFEQSAYSFLHRIIQSLTNQPKP